MEQRKRVGACTEKTDSIPIRMQAMEAKKPTLKSSRGSTQKIKMKKRKASRPKPKASPHNLNYTPLSDTDRCEWHSPSSSPRNLTSSDQPQWSMSALMAALPESASPLRSHASDRSCSPKSETYYSEIASEFSAPRNQSCGNSCNDNNFSSCFSDIDEWLEHANKFCKPSNFQTSYHIETDNSQRNRSPDDKLSMSSLCKTFFTAPDHELYSMTLPSIREESPVYQGHCHLGCINSIYEATKCGNSKDELRQLRCCWKPYDAYLNEVEREKLEAKRDAWKKAKHDRLIDRMRRKEAAINDWELQQTRTAMEEMEKFQDNLERKQLLVSAKTHKKICLVKEKAEMQKVGLRISTMKRIHKLQPSQAHTPAEISCGSSIPFF